MKSKYEYLFIDSNAAVKCVMHNFIKAAEAEIVAGSKRAPVPNKRLHSSSDESDDSATTVSTIRFRLLLVILLVFIIIVSDFILIRLY